MDTVKRAGDGGDAIVKGGDGGGDVTIIGGTIKGGDGGNIYNPPVVEIAASYPPHKPSFWFHPLAKWALSIVSGAILLAIGWVIKN